jgi:hypothetical protein
MFAGDDDLLNLIQIEANTLVDTILEESVSIVNNSASSYNPSPFAQDIDEQQLSREVSFDENENSFDPQPSSHLPLINNNSIINLPINNNLSDHAQISDEISENFAIKSDYDIIVKSPTIESMSGKSFEDDEVHNFMATATSAFGHDVSLDDNNFVSALHSNDNITVATNITPSTSVPSHELNYKLDGDSDEGDVEEIVQAKAQRLVDSVIEQSLDIVNDENNFKPSPSSSSSAALSDDENDAIVRNLSEQKLHRVERKFEHLSSEVREDDPATVDDLVNKEDISMLQTDFSKISWDESLSATTGEFGSSTPDNDLQDVLNIPGDTYRQLHNK